MSNCSNCSSKLDGPYCGYCGNIAEHRNNTNEDKSLIILEPFVRKVIIGNPLKYLISALVAIFIGGNLLMSIFGESDSSSALTGSVSILALIIVFFLTPYLARKYGQNAPHPMFGFLAIAIWFLIYIIVDSAGLATSLSDLPYPNTGLDQLSVFTYSELSWMPILLLLSYNLSCFERASNISPCSKPIFFILAGSFLVSDVSIFIIEIVNLANPELRLHGKVFSLIGFIVFLPIVFIIENNSNLSNYLVVGSEKIYFINAKDINHVMFSLEKEQISNYEIIAIPGELTSKGLETFVNPNVEKANYQIKLSGKNATLLIKIKAFLSNNLDNTISNMEYVRTLSSGSIVVLKKDGAYYWAKVDVE